MGINRGALLPTANQQKYRLKFIMLIDAAKQRQNWFVGRHFALRQVHGHCFNQFTLVHIHNWDMMSL